MKKLIALLLCGLMLCSLIIPASAAESTTWTQDELDAIVLSNPYWTVSKYEAFGSEVKFDGTSDAFWVSKSSVWVNGKPVGRNKVRDNTFTDCNEAGDYQYTKGKTGKWTARWTETDGIRFYIYDAEGEINIIPNDKEWFNNHPDEYENLFSDAQYIPLHFKVYGDAAWGQMETESISQQYFDIMIHGRYETETVTHTNGKKIDRWGDVTIQVHCIDRTYTTVQNPPVVTNYNYAKFSDIAAQAWYAPTIAVAYETGMLQGTGKDERGRLVMNPQGQLTLAQAITMAARIYEKMSGEAIDTPAIAGKPWYYPYYIYAYCNNLLPFNELRNMNNMNKPITRAQFAVIVAMLPKLEGQSGTAKYRISDVASTNKYSSSIQQLYYRGITQGNNAGLYSVFYPNKTLTRAEAAAMLCRTLYASMQKDNTQFKET